MKTMDRRCINTTHNETVIFVARVDEPADPAYKTKSRQLRRLLRLYMYAAFKWKSGFCSIHLIYLALFLLQIIKVGLITTQVGYIAYPFTYFKHTRLPIFHILFIPVQIFYSYPLTHFTHTRLHILLKHVYTFYSYTFTHFTYPCLHILLIPVYSFYSYPLTHFTHTCLHILLIHVYIFYSYR